MWSTRGGFYPEEAGSCTGGDDLGAPPVCLGANAGDVRTVQEDLQAVVFATLPWSGQVDDPAVEAVFPLPIRTGRGQGRVWTLNPS